MGYFDTKEAKARQANFEARFGKIFGDGVLKKGAPAPYEVLSTGSVNLDLATGVGGYVKGRLTEIWGNPDSGKTTLALLGVAEAQRDAPKKMVAYIDAEHKVDEKLARSLGVNLNQWFLHYPATAEATADAVKTFLDDPLFSMVVIDSIGALMGKVEQEKQADESVMAVTARIVTRMVKHATTFAPVHNSVVLILNQVRDTLTSYGSSTTTPGGRALKHATTMKIKLGSTTKTPVLATVKGERIPIGIEVAAKLERNKVAARGASGVFFLKTVATDKYGGVGIDKAMEAVTCGIKLGVIPQNGNRYTNPITGEVSVGKDSMIEEFRLDSKMTEKLRQMLVALDAPAEIDSPPSPEVIDALGEDTDDPAVSDSVPEVPESSKVFSIEDLDAYPEA